MDRSVGITIGIALAIAALSAGAAVLTTITVDGDMSDWSGVLADPLQTSFDGPLGPLPDLDAPVSTASLDITRFARTYDSASFYFQITRDTRSNGRNRFLLYLDTDFDGRMQSGEPVIELSWWGNARRTRTALHSYNAIDATGDPLGDAAGSADGWTPPGSLSTGPIFLQAYGGSADRLQVEAGVPWSLLGIAPGSPMHFHVASTTGTNLPGDAVDNMGGPGGRVGTTLFSGVGLSPPAVAGTVIADCIVPLAHVATNTGSNPDTINLSWSSSGSFAPSSVVFYRDVDADGALSGADVPLADTDGDTLPDSGASFDSSEAPPVTHIRWSFPAAFAPGDGGQISFEALIP